MKKFVLARSVFLAFPALLVSLATTAVDGQDLGGGDVGTPVVQPQPTVPTNQGTTSNVTTGGEAPDISIGDQVTIDLSENTRNQGFVGALAPNIVDRGFVGAASDLTGPALAEGASFGGGVNGTGGAGGGRATAAAGGRGGQQAGFGAALNSGVTVTRRSLRSRVRPVFTAPALPAAEVSSRFSNTFYRLPKALDFSGQFNVSVENRTAIITGSVATEADADSLVRQLRLQPGIYQIDNQLKIGQ